MNERIRELWIEAAEQEPVAWIEHEWSGTGLQHLYFERREPTVRDEVVNPVWTPLYTTPPQRTWVGLTDEDYDLLSDRWWKPNESEQALIDWVIERLKEKNT